MPADSFIRTSIHPCLHPFNAAAAAVASAAASATVDAFDQTKDYSTHVFSLGVLLSSLLIFNQVRVLSYLRLLCACSVRRQLVVSMCVWKAVFRECCSVGGG